MCKLVRSREVRQYLKSQESVPVPGCMGTGNEGLGALYWLLSGKLPWVH